MNILVVDNSARFCELISDILGQYGHKVTSIETVDEAMTDCVGYDLIFLDHKLGGPLTGIDVLRDLRSRGCKTKIIFISSFEEYAEASVEAGADKFVSKSMLYEEITKMFEGDP